MTTVFPGALPPLTAPGITPPAGELHGRTSEESSPAGGPRIGEMCAGYGGLGMAVMSVLGGELAWVADNDPGASAILAHRFPGVVNHGDITGTDWAAVEPVDILTAGFPCQDISYAGRGEGIVKGNRSGLWYAIADALGVLRPGLVVLENVAAIVGRRPGLDVVLGCLAELGFNASWVCVRAADVGAPHLRNRLVLAASPADPASGGLAPWGRVGDGWPAAVRGEAVRWAGDSGSAADPNSTTGRKRGFAASGQAQGWRSRADTGGRGGASPADPGCDPWAGNHPDFPAAAGGGEVPAADPPGCGWERERPGVRWGPDERDDAQGQPDLDWRAYGPAIHRWEQVLGRAAPRPAEPGRTGERLSPWFAEWMMGLPDGWVTGVPGLPRNAMLKALGNGAVPQQMALGLRLVLPAGRAA